MAYKQKGWSPFTRPIRRSKLDKDYKTDRSVMSADQMRYYRVITDDLFDEKAKNFEYTPQTEKRRLVVDLKPATKTKQRNITPQTVKDKYKDD